MKVPMATRQDVSCRNSSLERLFDPSPVPDPMKILVMDGDNQTRKDLKTLLQHSGFETLEAESGEEGIEVFRTERPEAVVLGTMLPGMDGFDACRQMRQIDAATAILFLAAEDQEMEKLRGFEAGADDYLVKPFNPDELMARLRAVLRRCNGRPRQEMVLGSGPVRLEMQTNRYFLDGSELDLTPKESALLNFFLKNPGRILDRTTLRQWIWGKNHFGSGKELDVYIRKLREKVEVEPSFPVHLRTVWGVGYIWIPEAGKKGSPDHGRPACHKLRKFLQR